MGDNGTAATSVAVQRHGEHVSEYFDVFWSHSGEQKPFVQELNRQLRVGRSTNFNNFLDTQNNSLPPGQPFPPNIDMGIRGCRLAVAVISRSFLDRFWTMKELSDLVEIEKRILPVFYGVDPRELVNDLQARAATWRQLHPRLTADTIDKWQKALLTVRPISGCVVDVNVNVDAPQVRRLLSNIRLILAANVLTEQSEHEIDGDKLQVACEDINNELCETNLEYMGENAAREYMVESAALLIRCNAIPNLARLLTTLCEQSSLATAEAVWSLDNILEKACNQEAKAEAVRNCAVEALAHMVKKRSVATKAAAFCLSNILGSDCGEGEEESGRIGPAD